MADAPYQHGHNNESPNYTQCSCTGTRRSGVREHLPHLLPWWASISYHIGWSKIILLMDAKLFVEELTEKDVGEVNN